LGKAWKTVDLSQIKEQTRYQSKGFPFVANRETGTFCCCKVLKNVLLCQAKEQQAAGRGKEGKFPPETTQEA
jgi:hypothetical protein